MNGERDVLGGVYRSVFVGLRCLGVKPVTRPEVGEQVAVKGEQGKVFTVRGFRQEPSGTVVSLWGGSKNPNGHQSWRFIELPRIIRKKPTRKRVV